jgi:hypothetical protein
MFAKFSVLIQALSHKSELQTTHLAHNLDIIPKCLTNCRPDVCNNSMKGNSIKDSLTTAINSSRSPVPSFSVQSLLEGVS